jgi:hypothetical protein
VKKRQTRKKGRADGHILQFVRFEANNGVQPDIGQDSGRVREPLWIGGGQFIEDLFPTWCKLGMQDGLVHTLHNGICFLAGVSLTYLTRNLRISLCGQNAM